MSKPRFPRGTPFHQRLRITESGCWEWQGYRDRFGYGQIRIAGKAYKVHRLMFERVYGHAPEVVRHSCDTPSCCNPDHLLGGTHADNVADRVARGRTRTGTLRGEKSRSAKLTSAQVVSICEEYAAGNVTQQTLATRYGIDQTQVSNIVRRQEWKEILLPRDKGASHD